jgi:putative ABC transport system permease protein
MRSLTQDLRFAFRVLLKNPGHSLAAVAALALGVGLVTAMFSIVYGVTLRGLPFEDPERILHLESANPSRNETGLEVFLHDFLDWRARQRSFEGLAGLYRGTVNLSGDGAAPERFDGAFVSVNLFELLRVRPALGRGLLPGEDTLQAPPVVILSYGVWHTRYQGDPKVLGRPVRINGEPGTIVGVMPQGFEFPAVEEVWVPLRLDPLRLQRGQGNTLEVVGRLREGVSLESARAEMDGIARTLAAEHPATNEGRWVVVKRWKDKVLPDSMRLLLSAMLGACLLVLLLGCTNVASLMTARASRRTREIAIRAALGARRRRILVQLLIESLLLSAAGAVFGVAFAQGGIRLFNAVLAGTHPPFWVDVRIDGPALAFALGITLLTALLSGLMPALQASRVDLNDVLKDEGRGSSSLRLGLFSRWIVVAEVAVSCLLLVGAGLMIRSVVSLRTLDLGFDPEGVFTARIALFESTYPEEAKRVAFFEELLARVDTLPGVAAAAAATSLPGLGSGTVHYRVDGGADPAGRDIPSTRMAVVSPGFFAVFGTGVLAGRGFHRLDTAESLPVAVVNKSFAEKVWQGQDPLGRRIRLVSGPGRVEPWRTVVGVAPDMQMAGLDNTGGEQSGLFVPLSQRCPRFVSIVAKTRTDAPLALAPLVREQVSALDPDLPIYFVSSMESELARVSFFPHLIGTLFAIFGIAALLLAAVGIYGVIAFAVSQRTQEIGIRMALGAQRKAVLRLILRQGMLHLLAGLFLGLAFALVAWSFLDRFLVGVEARDPATFAIVSGLLALVAFLACWFPAQRATRTDPQVAIRYE